MGAVCKSPYDDVEDDSIQVIDLNDVLECPHNSTANSVQESYDFNYEKIITRLKAEIETSHLLK